MAPSVMGDRAEAVLRQEEHLAFPRVGIQRPAVRERYGRALTPVLIVDLRAVRGRDRAAGAFGYERAHGMSPVGLDVEAQASPAWSLRPPAAGTPRTWHASDVRTCGIARAIRSCSGITRPRSRGRRLRSRTRSRRVVR